MVHKVKVSYPPVKLTEMYSYEKKLITDLVASGITNTNTICFYPYADIVHVGFEPLTFALLEHMS